MRIGFVSCSILFRLICSFSLCLLFYCHSSQCQLVKTNQSDVVQTEMKSHLSIYQRCNYEMEMKRITEIIYKIHCTSDNIDHEMICRQDSELRSMKKTDQTERQQQHRISTEMD